MNAIPVAKCRHCHRPITKPYGWLHTDGRVECLDVWRWDAIGSVAEPEPENPRLLGLSGVFRKNGRGKQ